MNVKSKNLTKIAHINAQSLLAHIDQIKFQLQKNDIDVLAVSETWLKPEVKTNSFCNRLEYIFVRNDRLEKTGGGVGFFIRKGIKHKILCAPEYKLLAVEQMWVELFLPNGRLALGVVY